MEKTFEQGQKIRCKFGKTWTVAEQVGNAVYVYENGNGAPLHVSNVWAA